MKPAAWRLLLLAICAFVAAFTAYDLLFGIGFGSTLTGITPVAGLWGNNLVPATVPFHMCVLSIDPGGASDLAGIRAGDLIDLRENSPLERFWLLGQPLTGRPVSLTIERGSMRKRVTVTPQTLSPIRRDFVAPVLFGSLWLILFAGVIAWRRSDVRVMRLLCLILIVYGLREATDPRWTSSPSVWIMASLATTHTLGTLVVALWAACAACFGPALSRLRLNATRLCYALVAVSIAIGLAKVYSVLTLQLDPSIFGSTVAALPFVAALAVAVACTALAINAAGGIERQRVIWSLVPVAVLIIIGAGADAAQSLVPSYEVAFYFQYVAGVFYLVVPLVLTYVALNRRLLDVGFVVNRAAVFAIVSAIVIGSFILVEWAASTWIVNESHATSTIVGMVVALALGLSLRYIHGFADKFVDNVFFRTRHENEAALRRFAHEAAYITDRTTLLDRAIRAVKASTAGAEASIITFDDDHATIDENDPALVSLRAWHKPVELAEFPESALRGQVAFPMVSRGRLYGVLVCGTRADNEAYAPDERDALVELANGVGSALGVLALERGDTLTNAVSELRIAIHELRELKT